MEPRTLLSHALTDHIHATLSMFVEDNSIAIPDDLGVSADGIISEIHTHDPDNRLHIHPISSSSPLTEYTTVSDLFDTWRTNAGIPGNRSDAIFNENQLFDNFVDADHQLRMFVNGIPSNHFGNYEIHDGDDIAIFYDQITQAEPQTLLSGSPLLLPLDGLGSPGQTITYTAVSDNPAVETIITEDNRSMRISVTGFGDMVFELFEDRAPRATDRIIELAESNPPFYDGIIFHRVLNGFVIQAGDPGGTGVGGSTLGNFDDQFDLDLQHNRSGLLSYAKRHDDTNDSQFFITEGPTRHLDFNHTIFGLLTEGEEVREAISNVDTNASGLPNEEVAMKSVEIFVDNRNAVLMLKAPNGSSAKAMVTVTAEDEFGTEFERAFDVTVVSDTNDGNPFLADIPEIRTTANTETTFQLVAIDAEDEPTFFLDEDFLEYNNLFFDFQDFRSHSDLTYDVHFETGSVTVSPTNDLVGVHPIVVATGVRGTAIDYQVVPIHIAPDPPSDLDLLAISDSGISQDDKITHHNTLQIDVSGTTDGALVKLYEGDQLIGESDGHVTITTVNLAEGVHTIAATQTVNDVESNLSPLLTVTVDNTAPGTLASHAPAEGFSNEPYSYDAEHAEEDTPGFNYSMAGAPAGMEIDNHSGLLSWTATDADVGANVFDIVLSDAAGNTQAHSLTITINDRTPGFEPLDSANKVIYTDANNDTVTVSLKGPGNGQVFVQSDGFDATKILLAETSDSSKLTISVKGGDGRTTVENIIVGNPDDPDDFTSIGRIIGGAVDVLGDVFVSGTINLLTLGNIVEDQDHEITFRGQDAKETVSITLRRVSQTVLNSGLAIKKLAVQEWLTGANLDDLITAPSIKSLTATGHFQANLNLSGQLDPKFTLAKAKIAGDLGSGDRNNPVTWDITGSSSSIDASKGTVNGWNLKLRGDLKKVKLGLVESADLTIGEPDEAGRRSDLGSLFASQYAAGLVQAGSIKKVTIKANTRVAGADGDFRAAMILTGPDADSRARYALGKASISGDLGSGDGDNPVTWDITGDSGSINASKGKVDGWRLLHHSNIKTVKLGEVEGTQLIVGAPLGMEAPATGDLTKLSALNWVGGGIDAGTAKSIAITGNRTKGLAGNFTGTMNLTGPAPDSKARLTLGKAKFAGRVADSIFTMTGGDNGSFTVTGPLENTTVNATGNIKSVIAGRMKDSQIRAGVESDVPIGALPSDQTQFSADRAQIKSVKIKGIRGEPKGTASFINSTLSAFTIGKVNLGVVQTDNTANASSAFGVASDVIASVTAMNEHGLKFPRLSKLDTPIDVPSDFDFAQFTLILV